MTSGGGHHNTIQQHATYEEHLWTFAADQHYWLWTVFDYYNNN